MSPLDTLSALRPYARRIAALLTCAPLLFAGADNLRTTSTYINAPAMTASGNYAAVVWSESATQQLYAAISGPGASTRAQTWSAAQAISDLGPSIQGVPSVAVGSDGTVIASWRQEVFSMPAQSQVVTRTYMPGHGWAPLQVLSTNGGSPVIAIASDGSAQIVYYESPGFYARAMRPGSTQWTSAVRLGDANYSGPAELAVQPGLGYAMYVSAIPGPRERLYLATYDGKGWHAGIPLTTSDADDGGQQLALTGGQGLIAWSESTNIAVLGSYLLRLPALASPFPAPSKGCQYAITRDGEITAACLVTGDAVTGCFDQTRGGSVQAYYVTVATYRRDLTGGWIPSGTVSDAQKRASAVQVVADGPGNVFITWSSEVPCQTGTNEVLARVRNAGYAEFRPGPEQLITGSVYSPQGVPDGNGNYRFSWAVISSLGGPIQSTIYASAIQAQGTIPGDLNFDGVVDCGDLKIVAASLGKRVGDGTFDARADTNSDGIIDGSDMMFVRSQMVAARCGGADFRPN